MCICMCNIYISIYLSIYLSIYTYVYIYIYIYIYIGAAALRPLRPAGRLRGAAAEGRGLLGSHSLFDFPSFVIFMLYLFDVFVLLANNTRHMVLIIIILSRLALLV